MRILFAFVIRLILLAALTFGFVVLFEHGPAKFQEGAKTEWNALLFFAGTVLSKRESVRSPVTADPAATPAPAPGASPPAKNTQTEGTNRPAKGTPAPNQ